MDPQLRRDPKFQNFVDVLHGFAYVGNVLEPYTVAGLQKVHHKAYLASAGKPPCEEQCSRTHGRTTTRWCVSCNTWRNKLLANRNGPYNNWENTESWNWSTSYENIANVFIPSFWNTSGIKFNEFGTACHLWTNCTEFKIGKALLKKARELRNKHFGHNAELKVDNTKKTKVFDTLKTLLSEQDVQGYLNVGQCIQDLDNIAKGDELKGSIGDMEGQLHTLCVKMDLNDATQQEILGAIRNQRDNKGGWRHLKKIVLATIIILATIAVVDKLDLVKTTKTIGTAVYQRNDECFSETYSYPFPQDLHLLPYFEEHSKLFGRNWLFEDIVKCIEENGSPEKGILITADMGYGKSAIVKHMLCSQKDEKAYKIRQQIVAFHLCRFDVPATKNPQRFIYRLVGFLSTKIPEFGAIVSLLPENALLFDDEKCTKEIVACFDQGVMHPLLEMKTIGSSLKIIVIDALDECYDKRSNDNALYDLLKARYKKFPKWIKFIITSRNISLIHNMHHLKHYSLDVSDQRNIADIKQYIEYKAALYPALRNFEGGLDTFLEQSEGLFLFVVHLLEYLTTNENETAFYIPETVSAIYEMNFERHFHFVADYEIARSILEIVIASLHPLSNNEVASILENLNVSSKDTTENRFENIAFCFRSFQELTLIHQTLHLWLISSEESKMFHVSAKRGHAMLSRYLLNQMNSSRADIVDVAIHIGHSNDTTLEKAFSGTYSNKNVTNSTIHKLVWKSDSSRALELLLNLHSNVDAVNEGNVTPSFVAAARGHLNQLKLLKRKGADLNFKVNDSYLITSLSQIDMIKHEYYFGYGLIHIAAKFGHSETVSFLLNQNKTLRYVKNGLGLTVVEMICENGNDKLLKLVLKSTADVGNCLYYAAKNNHIHIVNRLVHIGVNSSCISQTDAINASAKLQNVDITNYSIFTLHPDNIEHELLTLNDLWWMVNQESPLHAAIKAKSTETAIALIKHYPHLTDCVDAFGMTPFLLCVTENLATIFEILVHRVKTDMCLKPSTVSKVQPYSDVPICPVGGTYAHLDGIYGRFDLTKMIYQTDIAIDWLAPDSNSISAAHYAACNGNVIFLMFLNEYVKKLAWSEIRTNNRSTPYHSAAICGSIDAFNVMTDSFKNPPPKMYDIENKTLLHYIVMRKFTGHPAHVDDHEQANSLHLLKIILQSENNVELSDSYMRNILHYALENGHSHIVEYLYIGANVSFKNLIKQKDSFGNSPVEYALKSGPPRTFDILNFKMPYNCSFYDIFFSYCETVGQLNKYLSSWEIGLFITLQAATKEVADAFSNAFDDILVQNPYLTAAMLVYLKDSVHLKDLRKQFIKSIPYSPSFLSVWAVARHKPELFKVCGKLLSESPLHLMAYKYTEVLMKDVPFLHLAFGYPINTYALSCADSRGYNSFHYALMGGNIVMAIQLFNVGVSITNTKVSIKDITWMMLLAKKNQMAVHRNPECNDQLSCMDHLLERVLKKYFDNISYSDFCKNSTDLSLVHIVAASGMEKAMKTLHKKFGIMIFSCKNKDRISPMYLWDLFNNKSSSETFKISTRIRKYPFVDTEKLLLFGLLNDFPFGIFDDSPLQCIWNKQRSSVKIINCFERNIFKIELSITFVRAFTAVNIFLNSTLNAQINFENALFWKHGNIKKTVADVRFWASVFYQYFRALELSFNYPRLKTLVSHQLTITNCEQNENMTYRLQCIQLANELRHLINRVISYAKRDITYEYISSIKQKSLFVILEDEFLKSRMTILSNTKNPSSVFESEEFIFSNMYDGIIERHRYLNILKKTVKYQHVKEKLHLSVLGISKSKTLELTTNITRPFDDILRYVNASSYSHVLDSFQ